MPLTRLAITGAAAVIAAQLARPAAAPRPLVIAHATVIDGRGGPPTRDQTVVIAGSRIVELGPSGRVRVPRGARVVDGRGRYLIPGLWDMHVHPAFAPVAPGAASTGDLAANADYYLPLFIANGVTGVRDMAGDLGVLRAWRDSIARGVLVGPRMVITGGKLGDQAVVPGAPFPLETDEDARASVRALRQQGADFVKLGNLPPVLLQPALDEARRQRLPVAGHVPGGVAASTASSGGQRSIEHLTGILLASSSREAELRRLEESELHPDFWRKLGVRLRILPPTFDVQGELLASFDSVKLRTVAQQLRQNDTWQVPTFRLLGTLARIPGPDVGAGPRELYVEDVPSDSAWRTVSLERAARNRRVYDRLMNIVDVLHRTGVPFLAGTDTPTLFAVPGFSLHDELTRMVAAGFTPMEALQAATRGPAVFLGAADSLGTIERGKVADLVLLDANPLADIHNTRRIRAVVAAGNLLERPELDSMLATVSTRVAGWRAARTPRPPVTAAQGGSKSR